MLFIFKIKIVCRIVFKFVKGLFYFSFKPKAKLIRNRFVINNSLFNLIIYDIVFELLHKASLRFFRREVSCWRVVSFIFPSA